MAVNSVSRSTAGLDIDEELFHGVISGPYEMYKGLLESLDDVDVRNQRQRTLLHLGVKLGRADWVEGLLGEGADPGLRDCDLMSALDTAKEMCSHFPMDENRREILKLIRLISRRECALKRKRAMHGGDVISEPFAQMSHEMTQLSSLKDSLDDLKREMSNFKRQIDDAMDEVRKSFSFRDVTMDDLVKAVTFSLDLMGELSVCIKESADSKMIRFSPFLRAEDIQRECVDSLLEKTTLRNSNEKKLSLVRCFFGKLFDCCEETSCLLKFLKRDRHMKVMIDLDSTNIGNMKEKYTNNEGVECNGSKCVAFSCFKERKVYIGGEVNENRKEEIVLSELAWAFASMALFLAFENEGRPYEKGDEFRELKFKRALSETEEKIRSGVVMHELIKWALNVKSQSHREKCFAAVVPELLARLGSIAGTSLLREQVPSLLSFYKDHVTVELLRRAKP